MPRRQRPAVPGDRHGSGSQRARPAPILQSNQSTGTLYFDVTGAQPNQVVYNDGTQDVLLWTA